MRLKYYLKKLDERFSKIENPFWLKTYMFFHRLLIIPFKLLFKIDAPRDADDIQVVRTLDELDEMLGRLEAAQRVSDDELRKLFPTFCMEFNAQIPMDPYSDEYAKVQFDLYHKIAGRDYSVENEKSVFDLSAAIVRPFPYFSGSCETVGNHLSAIAHVIRSLKLKPGSKIVEFGPGWGNLTLILATMGFDVTAVDIEKNFCNLISKRAEQAGVKIRVVNADFSWIEQITEPVDAILFFESFHHSSDHLRVIKALDKAVKDDGKVYFAAEPITETFPIPWGIRLDGESLWAIRKNGWLELGFSKQYFLRTLRKFNWAAEEFTTASLPWATVYEATKQKKYSRTFFVSDPKIRTQIGVKGKDGSVVSGGSAGYLVYGPYVSLPASEYVAEILFSDTENLAGKGRMEVACRGGTVILAAQEADYKDLNENGKIQIKFTTSRNETDVEIRLFCSQGAIAKVYAIELEEIIEPLMEGAKRNGHP